ncbi:MAG: LCP family protein [Eggerthellaceae bacterium]|nr:LCP family protein [Eggerthellaceae bacterium]
MSRKKKDYNVPRGANRMQGNPYAQNPYGGYGNGAYGANGGYSAYQNGGYAQPHQAYGRPVNAQTPYSQNPYGQPQYGRNPYTNNTQGQPYDYASSARRQNAQQGQYNPYTRQAQQNAYQAAMGGAPQNAYNYQGYSRAAQDQPVHGRHAKGAGEAYGSHASMPSATGAIGKRKMKRGKKIALIILGIILALLLVVGAAFAWYMSSIDSAMKLDDADGVNAALTDTAMDEPFYVLLLGSDSREGSSTESYNTTNASDVIILARVDTTNKQVTLVSIPRDTAWTDSSGNTVKLDQAYQEGGAATSIKAVEGITGVKISHYAEIRFAQFEELIDSLGGIDVNVPTTVSYADALTGEQVTVEAGEQTLNGQEALIFARARHDYASDEESNRQKAVRQIVGAIVTKIQSKSATELPGTIMKIASCVGTDLNSQELLQLALAFNGGVTMYSGSGPSAGDYDSAMGGLWFCYDDPTGWSKLMQVVNSGGDPSSVSYSGDVVTLPGSTEEVTVS